MNTVVFDISKQEQLNHLLEDLVECVELSSTDLHSFTKRACDIYSDSGFRHSYAEISLILEQFRPDQRDALSAHFSEIRENTEDVLKEQDIGEQKCAEIKNCILKLCDHVDLECLRISRIEKVEYIGKTASNELSAADGKLKETESRAKELEKRVAQYHDQNIAILGIFAGLVVTFSGVVQFTSSSLENLSDVSAPNITLFVSLSFFFLFNVVFLLMYCISKIAGKSIASVCENRSCGNCRNCKTFFGRIKKKYPFVFWFNFIGIIFCGGLYFLCMR